MVPLAVARILVPLLAALMATTSAAFELNTGTSVLRCASFNIEWPGATLPVTLYQYYGPPGGQFTLLYPKGTPSSGSQYSPVLSLPEGYQTYWEVVDAARERKKSTTFTVEPNPSASCPTPSDIPALPSTSLQTTSSLTPTGAFPPPPSGAPPGPPPSGPRPPPPPSGTPPSGMPPGPVTVTVYPSSAVSLVTAGSSALAGASGAGATASPASTTTDGAAAAQNGASKHKSSNVGAIAGGFVGGVVGLLLLLLALLCIRRRRRNTEAASSGSEWAAGGLKSSSSSTHQGVPYAFATSGSDNNEAEPWSSSHPDAEKGLMTSPGLAPSHATSSSRTLSASLAAKGLSTPKRNTMISTASGPSMPSTPEVPPPPPPVDTALFAHGFPAPPPRNSVQSSPIRNSVATLPSAAPIPGSDSGHGGPWPSPNPADGSDDEPTSPKLSGPRPPPRRKQNQPSISGLGSAE